jgi:hypothetical protein
VSADEFTAEGVAKLSSKEQDVLGWIYVGRDMGHSRRTIESLLRKGWIEEYTEAMPGPGGSVIDSLPLMVKRYTYPCITAHMAWCEWCSTRPDDAADVPPQERP